MPSPSDLAPLFEPLRINGLTLTNRLALALISDPEWANKVQHGEDPLPFRREDLGVLS